MDMRAICLIDHTILMSSTSWQSMPWDFLFGKRHQSNDVKIFIPDFIPDRLLAYQEYAAASGCKSKIDSAIKMIPQGHQEKSIDVDTIKHLSVTMLQTQQQETHDSFVHMMAAALSMIIHRYPSDRVLLWTQTPSLYQEIIKNGYDAVLLHPTKAFVPVCSLQDIAQLDQSMIPVNNPLSIRIEPEKQGILHLQNPIPMDSGKIHALAEAIFRRYPKEAMFRMHTAKRSYTSDDEISYALPKKTIQNIIERTDQDTRLFIDSVYTSWTNDVEHWVEELREYLQWKNRFQPCVLILEHESTNPIDSLTLSITVEEAYQLMPSKAQRDIPSIPKLPILTQKMCANIDKIRDDEYLNIMGIYSEDVNFLSPSYDSITQGQESNTFILTKAAPRVLYYYCRALSAGHIAEIPFRIACRGSTSGTDIILHYTCSGSTIPEFSAYVHLKTICDSVEIAPQLEKIIRRELHTCL